MSYGQIYRFGNPPNYEPKREESIESIAAREGRTPQEAAYDIMLEDDGMGFIYAPITNYSTHDLSIAEAMLADPNAIMGLGDGGAHVGFILDAGYPTWLLAYWGKKRERWDVTELVRRLTSDTAEAAGLYDRRSEEHTSELQSLMRISYAVFCLKKQNHIQSPYQSNTTRKTH